MAPVRVALFWFAGQWQQEAYNFLPHVPLFIFCHVLLFSSSSFSLLLLLLQLVVNLVQVRTAKALDAFTSSARRRFPVVKEVPLGVLPDGTLPPGFRDHHKLFVMCGGARGLARWDALLKKPHRRSRKEKKADGKAGKVSRERKPTATKPRRSGEQPAEPGPHAT